MPIYKYTLKKYAKSYSTWIISIITAILIIISCGVLPFKVFLPQTIDLYSKTILTLIPIVITFLSIFSSVFASFKSANMFKDEIEDGTFLIIISKPISRSKIFIYKWLSLQTFLILYSLFTSMMFVLTLIIFDNGNEIPGLDAVLGFASLKQKFWQIFGYTFIILFIMSLIFSSIALLISAKLSVSSTIGISIALGIIIPLTPVIRIFTQKDENIAIIKPDFFERFSSQLKFYNDSLESSNSDLLSTLYKDIQKSFLNKAQKKFNKLLSDLNDGKPNIYNLAIGTSKKNTYKNLWYLDMNYQIYKLSSFVYDQIIPPSFQEVISFSKGRIRTNYYKTIQKDIFSSQNSPYNYDKSLKKFNDLIINSWNKTKDIRADMIFLWSKLFYYNRKNIYNFLKKQESQSMDFFALNQSYDFFHRMNNNKSILEESVDSPATTGDITKLEITNVLVPRKKHKISDNIFNKTFYDNIEKIVDIIRKSNNPTSLSDVKKVASLFRLMWDFDKLFYKYIPDNKNNIDKSFYSITMSSKKMLDPIDSIHRNGIRDFVKYNNLNHSARKRFNSQENWYVKKDLNAPLKFVETYGRWLIANMFTSSPSFAWTYDNISNLIYQRVPFNTVEKKQYVSKYTILVIFMITSLLLIPITYLTIRKKDFK